MEMKVVIHYAKLVLSVSVVTVNECSINERQPGTIHIHIIMLYILIYECRF